MLPYFNTSGPCVPSDHYMLPPERRLGRIMALIDDHRYVTLHAGRQTGKTTCARWLTRQLNAQGRFHAVYVEVAKERIILERRSHIDSLVSRLREERVRRVLDPMLVGDLPPADMLDDDLSYCAGLGLIVIMGGSVQIANPIYREVIPRALSYARQVTLAQQPARFIRPDGRLDMEGLLVEFQQFWRKDGHMAMEGLGYREAAPHLVLMAFLQRIVNGGGRIEREYGLGRGALDLLVQWHGERHAIEVKLRRTSHTEGDALDQITRYLDHIGLAEGYLVLFDLRKRRSWTQKLTRRERKHRGKRVHLIGC